MASSQEYNKFYEHRASVLGKRSQEHTTKYAIIESFLNQKDIILDIGCGRGEILTPLQQKGYTAIGVDSCKSNVLLLNKTVCDNCTSPRKYYGMFNTFLVLDLLEHLNAGEEHHLFNNLNQSTKHKLILCVPNDEDIEKKSVVCPSCDHKFHPYGHLRNFNVINRLCFLEDKGYTIKHTYYLPNWLNIKFWFIPLFIYKWLASFAWQKGNIIIEATK